MAASASDKFMHVGEPGTATTLAAPGYTIGNASINVASTTNWPTTTGVIFGIDTAEVVDGEEVRVAGTYCVFSGVVTSATSIGSLTLESGTPQNYAAGALTRVYITVSAIHNERLIDGLIADHSQLTGGHEVASNFDPSNPTLETQKWSGVASAINEVTVTNAAIGNAPFISATGDDTNIGLDVTSKGTGGITAWAGNKARELLKLLNVASAVNEVTISPSITTEPVKIEATGDDTNIGINLAPKGTGEVQFGGVPASGAWQTWVPTLSGRFDDADWTKDCKYKQIGKTVYFRLFLTATAAAPMGGGSSNAIFTLPVTSVSLGSANRQIIGHGFANDDNGASYPSNVMWASTTTALILTHAVSGANIVHQAINSTAPFTWTTSDVVWVQGFYEVP